jgi:hypothetical protein
LPKATTGTREVGAQRIGRDHGRRNLARRVVDGSI